MGLRLAARRPLRILLPLRRRRPRGLMQPVRPGSRLRTSRDCFHFQGSLVPSSHPPLAFPLKKNQHAAIGASQVWRRKACIQAWAVNRAMRPASVKGTASSPRGFHGDSVDHTREVHEALCRKTLSLSARDGLEFCQNADGEDSSQCGWGRVPENRTEKRGHPRLSPGLAQGPLRLEPLETKQPGGS